MLVSCAPGYIVILASLGGTGNTEASKLLCLSLALVACNVMIHVIVMLERQYIDAKHKT